MAPRNGALLGTLAGVVGLRVMGVSLLLAGFVEHAHSLGGSTRAAGLAFGAYPLALALLTLPLAALSDRVGRRSVMLGALSVSVVGGLLAAVAPTVELLAAARFLQGAGAVNGVALALVGESGEPERRTRRMATLGAAAGGGFVAGIVLGALLLPWLGIPGLLVAHSIASAALLWPVAKLVPAGADPAGRRAPPIATRPTRAAWLLALAAFGVSASLTALMFLSPLLLADAPIAYWLAILVMTLPAGGGMFLAARLADRGHARAVGVTAAAALAVAPLAFVLGAPLWAILLAGVAFFLGHSSLSSLLPSLASALAPEGRRGATQGLQSTLQYLGSFAGSALGAALWPREVALVALFLGAGALVAVAVTSARSA